MIYNPHGYQRRATWWILSHTRCALFLEMGLGKTVATLTAIAALKAAGYLTHPVLVVAPKKVAELTWQDEISKWNHLGSLTCSTVLGPPQTRIRALKSDADIYVTSRDSLTWLADQPCCPQWSMLVLDELTSYKSHKSQRFAAAARLASRTPYVVGLTGTPIPNGLQDIWSQIFLLDGGARLGQRYSQFEARWLSIFRHNGIPVKTSPRKGAEEEVRSLISDICLSMRAEDYLELPDRRVIDVQVVLPPKSLKRYLELQREYVLEALDERGVISASNAAVLGNKLSQLANGAIFDDNHTWHAEHQAKIETLSELIEMASTPILCFYQYTHDAERILSALSDKVTCRLYQGAEDAKDWSSGEIRLLLAHPASCAYGINLQTGGHTIVWFGTGWNLELYEQANARLHRQGQRMPVTIYRLVCSDTIDVKMAAALEGKADMQEAFMAYLSNLARNI